MTPSFTIKNATLGKMALNAYAECSYSMSLMLSTAIKSISLIAIHTECRNLVHHAECCYADIHLCLVLQFSRLC
jgi:hypothetical protein